MSSPALQDHPPFAGHSPEQERPLGGYAVLMGTFAGLCGGFMALVICPYCLSMWLATGFIAGLAVAPRPTRWIASIFVAVTGAEPLQIAYSKGEQAL
jgi:hypothetical protein